MSKKEREGEHRKLSWGTLHEEEQRNGEAAWEVGLREGFSAYKMGDVFGYRQKWSNTFKKKKKKMRRKRINVGAKFLRWEGKGSRIWAQRLATEGSRDNSLPGTEGRHRIWWCRQTADAEVGRWFLTMNSNCYHHNLQHQFSFGMVSSHLLTLLWPI